MWRDSPVCGGLLGGSWTAGLAGFDVLLAAHFARALTGIARRALTAEDVLAHGYFFTAGALALIDFHPALNPAMAATHRARMRLGPDVILSSKP
jgi:hypothetical protein